MKTITEHLREHLYLSLGYVEKKRLPDLGTLQKTEWCPEFEKYRLNRLIMGAFRYGLLGAKNKTQWDRIEGIQYRLELYKQTGNMEYLLDIANLAMLEWVEGEHPNKHFNNDAVDHNKVSVRR
jgi:hypothetical protein